MRKVMKMRRKNRRLQQQATRESSLQTRQPRLQKSLTVLNVSAADECVMSELVKVVFTHFCSRPARC